MNFFNKLAISCISSLLFVSSSSFSQTSQGIGSIMDELDNQQTTTNPSSTSGQQSQLNSLCLSNFGKRSNTSKAQRYCQCFSALMVTKLKAHENDYYIQMMNVIATTKKGTQARQTALVNVSIKAVESGLTEKDTKYIRRQGQIRMNVASGHVEYGDKCTAW